MDRIQAKYEQQVMLAARLREFSGSSLCGCTCQKDFLITALREITYNVLEIKKAALAGACERFLAGLDGPRAEKEITVFKEVLDKLVSGRSYLYVTAAIAGSRGLLNGRIAGLEPQSLAQEESRGLLKDPAGERLVAETYRSLRLDALEKECAGSVGDLAVERALAKARLSVADYCALYRVPISKEDTLTPFSLSRVDAVAAACYRLLRRLRGPD